MFEMTLGHFLMKAISVHIMLTNVHHLTFPDTIPEDYTEYRAKQISD